MNPWRGLRGLPREVWVVAAATLINRAGTMVLPFLVLYLTQGLGFSVEQAGLTLTIYGIGALITAPISGRLSDKIGALRIMKWSLFMSGVILLLFPLARSLGAVLAITISWAITSEAVRPASMAIISSLVAPEQRKAVFALNRLVINLGMSVGPAIAGFLALVSFQFLFVVDGATSLLAAVVLALMLRIPVPQTATEATGELSLKPKRRLGALADRRVLFFLAAMLPVELVLFQTQGAMPLFLVRDLSFPAFAYGLLLAINTVIIIFVEVPLNTAMQNWPHHRAMALGALLFGLGFGALAFTDSIIGVGATVVVWTFGEMVLFPSGSAYVAEIAPPERLGTYMGLYTMTFSAAFMIGPWLGLFALEQLGARVLWCATLATGLISATMLWRLPSTGEAIRTEGEPAT
ncbi:MAG: MFS transporter [Blastocatellia bacterium]